MRARGFSLLANIILTFALSGFQKEQADADYRCNDRRNESRTKRQDFQRRIMAIVADF